MRLSIGDKFTHVNAVLILGFCILCSLFCGTLSEGLHAGMLGLVFLYTASLVKSPKFSKEEIENRKKSMSLAAWVFSYGVLAGFIWDTYLLIGIIPVVVLGLLVNFYYQRKFTKKDIK
jgi:uncharacterized membrane protein YfcA